jgi:hypothetical protein
MLRSRICTGFGREVVCENADALDGHVFGRLNARHNDWFPHVNPILDVCGKGDSKKGLKSLRSVSNEDIDINGKYLIAFQVKQFHFHTKAAVIGLVLGLQDVTMDQFVAIFPGAKEIGP